MDSEVFRYIVIIGAVVIWIVSKLAKSKPADTSTTPPPLSPTNKKSLDDWWNDLQEAVEKKEMKPAPQPVTKPQSIAKKAVKQPIDSVSANYFENKHKNYKNAELSSVRAPLQRLEVIDGTPNERQAQKSLNINLKSSSEARRAFVYAEIFNRKY
ncbi:MAG: hypothetical protein LBS01_06045 [Prevotellaceae bacterium]|jgi:hypothetical protein|nr:hypothetical protein [Prevotellaceae bacterium]